MNAIRKRPLSGFKYNFCGSIVDYNPFHVKYVSEIRTWVNWTDSLIKIPTYLLQADAYLTTFLVQLKMPLT